MFTGIIEEVGTIFKIKDNSMVILSGFEKISKGDSICVNGVCLTVKNVTKYKENKYLFEFDVSEETSKKTSFKYLKVNEKINLERAMSGNNRLGGHFVTGHVDTTGKIISIKDMNNSKIIKISCEIKYSRYIVNKGSIAVDGISLTVVEKEISGKEMFFTVSIIPYTYENTTLCLKKVGSIVNIETDIIAKYVSENVGNHTEITEEFLKRNGYL